jgi:Zn-dependent protease
LPSLSPKWSLDRLVADFILALPILPFLLFSVVAHEYAHAWAAYRQGDDTAYALGRLTLNPLPHIDPMMSVIFPIGLYVLTSLSGHPFTFGAARPVPVNPANYRHYRRGDVIVSAAGIITNLFLAVVATVLFAGLGMLADPLPGLLDVLGTLQRLMAFAVLLNFTLAVFNVLPIPPLDGSHLFYHLLPARWGAQYRRVGRYGIVVIFAAYLVPQLWNVLLWPVDALTSGALSLVGSYALPTVVR